METGKTLVVLCIVALAALFVMPRLAWELSGELSSGLEDFLAKRSAPGRPE